MHVIYKEITRTLFLLNTQQRIYNALIACLCVDWFYCILLYFIDFIDFYLFFYVFNSFLLSLLTVYFVYDFYNNNNNAHLHAEHVSSAISYCKMQIGEEEMIFLASDQNADHPEI